MSSVCYVLAFIILHLLTGEQVSSQEEWGEWSAWSSCSKTCGFGQVIQERTRGAERIQQVQSCFTKECESVGKWSDWTGWSQCSDHCDGGMRTRSRFCTSIAAHATDCGDDKDGVQTGKCNEEPCPALPLNFDITKCTEEDFICRDQLMCVPKNNTCDKTIHCHDASDELKCWQRKTLGATDSGGRLSVNILLVMFYAVVAFMS